MGVHMVFDYGETPSLAEAQSLVFTLSSSLIGRRFFLSYSSYTDIGLASIQVRCEIHIIGGVWHLLLRKTEMATNFTPDSPLTQPLHTFTGDCYVHAIMDGEYVRSLKSDLKSACLK